VFAVDEEDPDHVDVYTNSWTPYPTEEDPVVHLYFPSFYSHFTNHGNPYGFGNDGNFHCPNFPILSVLHSYS